MGPTWGPSGANRTQVGPIVAPWTLLSGYALCEYKVISEFYDPCCSARCKILCTISCYIGSCCNESQVHFLSTLFGFVQQFLQISPSALDINDSPLVCPVRQVKTRAYNHHQKHALQTCLLTRPSWNHTPVASLSQLYLLQHQWMATHWHNGYQKIQRLWFQLPSVFQTSNP